LATLHYASGGGLDSQGNFTPAEAGFNLADVSYADQLNQLPSGVQGLVWLDQYHGVTQDFIDQVTPFIGNPKVYGFYLVDEPDPTGKWGVQASAADLKAESDWIHSHVPGAKTFTVLMNMGTSDNPDYTNTYTPENTHIDLFGLDWYPVWSDRSTVDYSTIDKYVAAAHNVGISTDQIVPVYQAFGGGNWQTESGSQLVMPTAAQEQQMIDHWASLVPHPAFDYAYAWGSQNGDTALESSPELQHVFQQHNTSGSTSTVNNPIGSTPPVTEPVTDTSGSTPPVADTSGSTPPVTGGSTTPVADTSGSTTPVASTGGDTTAGSTGGSSSDPTTSPTTDVSGSGHHQGGLDFSQFLGGATPSSGGGTSPWGGGHDAFTRFAATATANTTADTTSSSVADATPWQHLDLTSHNTDHHAWHW
jgi:hypothetical protein